MESIERGQASKAKIGDVYGEHQKEITSEIKTPELKGNQKEQRQERIISWEKEDMLKFEKELDDRKLRIEKIRFEMKNRKTVKPDERNVKINKILIAIKKDELSLIRRKRKLKRLEAVIDYQALKNKIK